jgi:putative heme iron utilization protein
MTIDNPFSPEVAAQIAGHLNAEENLLIVRALGGIPDATAARMSGLDADGMEFAAVVDGIQVPVRIPFSERLTSPHQVRTEATRMHRDACVALGVNPRD